MFVAAADASILHADLDAFFASVEQRDHAELRGRPVIVGMGVVMCASYEARAHGVRTAMGGAIARRLCPHAVFVEPHLAAYTAASKAVFEVFDDTTPFVEGISIDEAFLDVSGLWRTAGTPAEIAVRLRGAVRERVGLPISVGVARTKFLAKVASAVSKPDGLLVVPSGGELAFLHALPVERMWGIGAKTAAKLHARGVDTIGDIARLPEAALIAMVGRGTGRAVHALARNHDPRPVRGGRRRGSIGSQRALGRSPRSEEELDAVLLGLADRVCRRLRRAGRVARSVHVRLRFDDFTRITRSHTLARATDETSVVVVIARGLLGSARQRIDSDGCTLLGLSLSGLDDAEAMQLSLPFAEAAAVDRVLDGVRDKYGSTAITRAVLLGRDEGITMPMLPD